MNVNSKSTSSSAMLERGRKIRPVRDWYILLCMFFIALLASIAWNVSLFKKVSRDESISPAGQVKTAAVTTSSVQQLFAKREAERLRYVTEYRFIDPSL